jgi:formate dehydrogenase major subunit
MSEIVNIILNGKNTTAQKGEYILAVAKRNGIEIPTLCHDPRLEPFSSCYVCVIEIEGQKNLQPSCSTRVSEGMSIITDSKRVHKARKTALDLLVSNHYADCVAPCRERCPAGVDVQGYISLIEKGLYSEAVKLIKEVNPLPAICGRVCVRPCETACRRNLMDEGAAVGIDYMKRFASDADLESENPFTPEVAPSTGKKIAIIGAGPGGLSAAYFLQTKGHQCDIYEGQPYAGGWLRYGIPEYRLPNDLLQKEVDAITKIGTNIFYNKKLGENLSFKELSEKYDATILTIGSQRGTLLGAVGDDAENVFSGIDFLRNMEQTGQRYNFKGKRIAVVGGGNTAMDCCRTSIRCGSTDVTVVYRRSEQEMPANPIEIHESKLEGVKYRFLTAPVKVNKDEQGRVKSLTVIEMELGEPDASGRRRPVPKEGSEKDLEFDYILAAIGQKTDINFLDDINQHAKGGMLKPNKYGDIDADPKTLQTGIPSVFAAGDGVTGPATIIEAIAQAKVASRSCHQYLMGEEITEPKKEFLSLKDNFRKQEKSEYTVRYQKQLRQEMPVMEADARLNFHEVELGYSEEQALEETSRCLECGCVAYFSCDLKHHCDTYGAEQQRYGGDHKEFTINFSHPYIEIDSNKCILCSRCVRICKDVVGANALTLVNRGFDTYVAPSMGYSLLETTCESCGLCLSACPTGALTENVPFKPGPVRLETFDTICGFCSVGCKLTYHHRNGYIMKVTGANGEVNTDGNLCMYGKFGYTLFNDSQRIKTPLLKENGTFKEISFDEAFAIISKRYEGSKPSDNAIFVGGKLTNEEIAAAKNLTEKIGGSISSFHLANSFTSYNSATLQSLEKATKAFVFGSNINRYNPVVGYKINSLRIPIAVYSKDINSPVKNKTLDFNEVFSFNSFIRAANFILISKGNTNEIDNTEGFKEYINQLLQENFAQLCSKASSGGQEAVEKFAQEFISEKVPFLIASQREVCDKTLYELNYLMLLSRKEKDGGGLLIVSQLSNSKGVTNNKIDGLLANNFAEGKTKFSNVFILGEDPVGCSINGKMGEGLKKCEFVVVQDNFLSETAKQANLILPASFWFEIGGSFTNFSGLVQSFSSTKIKGISISSAEQIKAISSLVKSDVSLKVDDLKHQHTKEFNNEKQFNFGCSHLVKRFDKDFDTKTKSK